MSAGFASVFGTPLAGAVFGFEVLTIGKLRYDAIFPCFVAALVGHTVTQAWGIHHATYVITPIPTLNYATLLCAILAGSCFGITGAAFAHVTHSIHHFFKRVTYPPMRPFIGGILVALSVALIGTTRYIGLGTETIIDSFHNSVPPWDFIMKFGFTTLTLGSGFKGGEVTPLFFIGATLGNALSRVLPIPSSALTGMGFVAVFAGAANTPLSSTLMAVELFGSQTGALAGLACVASYLFSGHSGIYRSQKTEKLPKVGYSSRA